MTTVLGKDLIGLGIHSEPAVLIGAGGGGIPGGTSGQLQFNNASAFGGTTNFEFDSAGAALRGLTGLTGGIRLFNTADITTNTEFLRANWATNIAYIGTDTAGSGTMRELRLGVSNTGTLQNAVRIFGSAGTPFVRFTNANSGNTAFVGWDFVHGTLSAASGNQTLLSLTGTINQSATCGYTGMLINVTETATGSGVNNLLLGQVGGANRFRFDRTGGLTLSSPATDGFSYFNTADEVTNRELFRVSWASNVLQMQVSQTGSGTIRELRIGNTTNYLRMFAPSAGTQFEFTGSSSSVTATAGVLRTGFTSTSSSGDHIFHQFSTVVNQSGTAGYVSVDINVTETTTGSAGKSAFQTRLGGVVQFQIGNSGRLRHIAANSSTTVGATGAAAALPANPLGYLIMEVGGTPVKFPYYNN